MTDLISRLEAAEGPSRVTLPIERRLLGGHHVYCGSLPPEWGQCTCGLAALKARGGE